MTEQTAAYKPSTRAVAVALHRMTVEDNPGHAEWHDCGWSEQSECFKEAVRLVEQLSQDDYAVVSAMDSARTPESLPPPLQQADQLLGDVIALVILAASTDNDPRFRALLLDQRDILRTVRKTLGLLDVC